MSSNFYIQHRLTGNTKYSLDSINPLRLKDGDVAITVSEGCLFFHHYKTDCFLDHNPPNVIKPQHNNYGKRWLISDVRFGYHELGKYMFRGFSFWGEPSATELGPFFYIWQSDGSRVGNDGDVFVKLRNTKGVLKLDRLATFSEMEKVSDIVWDFDATSVSRRKIHRRDVSKTDSPDTNVSSLASLHEKDIEVGDIGITFDGSSVSFYFVAYSGSVEEDHPYIFYPWRGEGQKCWKLSGIVGSLIFRDGGNRGIPLDREPPNPPNGSYIIWADAGGSRLGREGDVHLKVTNTKGETRHTKIVDFAYIGNLPILDDINLVFKEKFTTNERIIRHKDNVFVQDSSDVLDAISHSFTSTEVLDQNDGVSYAFNIDVERDVLVTDSASYSDSLPTLDVTKYVVIEDVYFLSFVEELLSPMRFFDKKVSETGKGIDKLYPYIKLDDYVHTEENIIHYFPPTRVTQKVFYSEKPIRVIGDFSVANESFSKINNVVTYATATESLNIWNNFTRSDEVEVLEEMAFNSQTYFLLQDVVNLSDSYVFDIVKENAPTVDKPDVTVDFSSGDTTPTFYGSSFNISGGSESYTHVASDWKVLDFGGNLIYKSLSDADDLTELTMPSYTLFTGNKYTVLLRYEEQDLGKGSWGSKEFEV